MQSGSKSTPHPEERSQERSQNSAKRLLAFFRRKETVSRRAISKPYKNRGLVNIRPYEGLREVETVTCRTVEIP